MKPAMRLRGRNTHSEASVEGDLTRLADGTLEGSRRQRVERLVAGSPELQARLREQRRAVAATRSLAHLERAPVTLRMQEHAFAPRGRRSTSAFGLGLAGAAGAMVWTLVALGGGQATLTVAQAATVAVRPATALVAKPPDDQVTLPHLRASGLAFPYWEDRFGWRADGTRTDHVDGRTLTTVFYRRGAQRIAYTIVGGQALAPASNASTTARGGTLLASSTTGGRLVVTWLRRGHTCVLSASRGMSTAAMLTLAGWRGHGRIPY